MQIIGGCMRRYWICNAAAEHVRIVAQKGYTQINMGPRGPLAEMNIGDWILYYSPTEFYAEPKPVRHEFTGIACIRDTKIYPQGNKHPDHWRRNVDFFECTPHHVKHFLDKVDFLPKESNWIEILSKQFFEISRQDFSIIAQKIVIDDESKILLY